MTDKTKKTIALFGSSAPLPGDYNYLQAYNLGKALAAAGYNLANGGYSGVMAASAHGAHQAGAHTTGVTCDAFGRSGPNQWIDKEIRTKDLNQRLITLINLADAYVVLPGSTGTLLEIAMVWELINKHFLPQRPIIFLSTYWQPVINTVVQNDDANTENLIFAQTQDDVIQILNDFFR